MKAVLQVIAAALVLGLGAGGVFVADHYGALPGLEPAAESGASACPHTLDAEDCPFCDSSLIAKRGECGEHGVPEALCHRCRPSLVQAFKAVNDWCGGHSVPESQCYDCNPDLLRGRTSRAAKAPSDDVELLPRALRAPDFGCRTETLRVKFKSPEVAGQIGLEVSKVTRRQVTESLSCNAELAYDGRRYARLGPRAAAVVSEIKKDLGQRVEAGDVIAVLRSVDLAVAQTELLKLEENVKTARVKLEQARATFERMNLMELRLAAVEYLKARELQEVARRNVEREERLLSSKATSERELLSARASALKAEAAVKALAKKLVIFGLTAEAVRDLSWATIESIEGRGTNSAQPYLDAQIALREALAEQQTARTRLRLLGLTEEDIRLVENERDSSGELPLYAPFAGVLVERRAVVGEAVEPGDVLFALADTSNMWAMIDIEEEHIDRVREGQPVLLQVQGLRGSGFKGRVTWLSTRIEDRTRVLKARAEFVNEGGRLRSKMFARARILLRDERPSLLVPRSAVQWEGCCNVVFVRLGESLFEPRKVQLAFETGDHAVISEGLGGDELVVTTGSFLLKTEILKGNIGAGCCGD